MLTYGEHFSFLLWWLLCSLKPCSIASHIGKADVHEEWVIIKKTVQGKDQGPGVSNPPTPNFLLGTSIHPSTPPPHATPTPSLTRERSGGVNHSHTQLPAGHSSPPHATPTPSLTRERSGGVNHSHTQLPAGHSSPPHATPIPPLTPCQIISKVSLLSLKSSPRYEVEMHCADLTVMALAVGSFEWITEYTLRRNSSTFIILATCFLLLCKTFRIQSLRKLLLKKEWKMC